MADLDITSGDEQAALTILEGARDKLDSFEFEIGSVNQNLITHDSGSNNGSGSILAVLRTTDAVMPHTFYDFVTERRILPSAVHHPGRPGSARALGTEQYEQDGGAFRRSIHVGWNPPRQAETNPIGNPSLPTSRLRWAMGWDR